MRLLPTRRYGILDYLTGLASPWLFDFAGGGTEPEVPDALGRARA